MTIGPWIAALPAAGLLWFCGHDALERRRRDRRVADIREARIREARIRDEAALGIHDITEYLQRTEGDR
ncbi:hypothetical protein ACFY97_18450 [Streptomyces klenkii]|uniref:hypothetical protein n=1 Tax=Streptomyces klenkii TaxID=1420899 RepID=UPI0036EDE77F